MRYFLGFLITIGLIILIIVLLVSGGHKSGPQTHLLNLTDYTTTNSNAQLVIQGPVVADQEYNESKIVVDQNTVTATLYNGYEDSVAKNLSYANNQTAYAVFLHALQHSGFTLYDNRVTQDERGYCPQGLRYILTFTSDGNTLRRSWTTSCGSSVIHSFTGEIQPILNLFQAQVPDYDKLVTGTRLS